MADKFPISERAKIDGENFIDNVIKEGLEKREYAHQESIRNHPRRMEKLKESAEEARIVYNSTMEELAGILIEAVEMKKKEVTLRVDPGSFNPDDYGLLSVSRVIRAGLCDTLQKKGYDFNCVVSRGGVFEFVVKL